MSEQAERTENDFQEAALTRTTVPGGHARSFEAVEGDYIAIVDVEGGQTADVWALDADDFDHYMSSPFTIVEVGSLQPQIGDHFVTNQRVPILTVVADDVGQHDMLYPACDKERYARYFDVTDHRNCHDNFLEAMEEYDWGSRLVPNPPLNAFMHTTVEEDRSLVARDPLSNAGDKIVFRAEMDIVGVVSACPMDLTPIGSQGITDLEIIVTGSLEALEEQVAKR